MKEQILTILIGLVQNPEQLFTAQIMWKLELDRFQLNELLNVITNSQKLTRDQQGSCILDLIINSKITQEEKQQLLDQRSDIPINPRKIIDQNFPGTQEQKIERIKKLHQNNQTKIMELEKENANLIDQLKILQAQSVSQPRPQSYPVPQQPQTQSYPQQYNIQPQSFGQSTYPSASQPTMQIQTRGQVGNCRYIDGNLLHFEQGLGCDRQQNIRNLELGCKHYFCEYCLFYYIFNKISVTKEEDINIEIFHVKCPQSKVNQQPCPYEIKTAEFQQVKADLSQ